MNAKKSLLVGAALATVTVGGASTTGLVSAATNNTTPANTSIVDKIATKFHLNKSDVQAVFDQDRTEHRAQMETQQKERLAQAVKDGKLTQAQADHITQAQTEIKNLLGDKKPNELDDSTRSTIKTKMDALRDWAKTNNIDMQYIGPHGHHGPSGAGMMDGNGPHDMM